MKKIELTQVTALTSTEAAAVNGGGSAEEYGKQVGGAIANALTFEPLVNAFGVITDWYYGV